MQSGGGWILEVDIRNFFELRVIAKRKTAPSRFTRAVTRIAQWCRIHRHHPLAEQHQTLSQKLRGHFAYYGITGNSMR